MNIPKKVYLMGPDITIAKFTLPSGKLIKLHRGDTYRTEDTDELEFFSNQKGVGITEIDGRELKRFFAQVVIPTVDNVVITVGMVDKFKWTTKAEAKLIEALKGKGYEVFSKDEFAELNKPAEPVEPTGILKVLLPKKEDVPVTKTEPAVTHKVAPKKRAPAKRRAAKKK